MDKLLPCSSRLDLAPEAMWLDTETLVVTVPVSQREPRVLVRWLALLSLTLLMITLGTAEEPSTTEGIDSQYLKTVVSIEVLATNQPATAVGSAFMVGHASGMVMLVTAKHVIEESNGAIRPNLGYRLNRKDGKSDIISDEHATKYAGSWFLSSSTDVAMRFIVFDEANSDIKVFPQSMMLNSKDVRPAARVIVAGFPLGLRSEQHAVPVIRAGVVARSDETGLLIDGFTFPGNSGGPVVYTPTIKVSGGLKSPFINVEKLIGLVSSQISYTEAAISPQTKRPRITFEDNSGLTIVIPAQSIKELMDRDDVKALVRRYHPDWKE